MTEFRSDLGNARHLLRLHGDSIAYCPPRACWYTYGPRALPDGRESAPCWTPDTTQVIRRLAITAAESRLHEAGAAALEGEASAKADIAWAFESQSRVRIDAALAMAEAEGQQVLPDDYDSTPWLLGTPDGTVVITPAGASLRFPRRVDRISRLTAADWDPDARSELWDALVWQVSGGSLELAAYLQRALGLALVGEWREKAFWFACGLPDSGKSTLLSVVASVLGEYAVSADASTWLQRGNVGGTRGDVMRLRGARLVVTSEIPPHAAWDHELLKRVTGGDPITGRDLYERDSTYRPRFVLWLAANDRPRARADDSGFWRRCQLVPFTSAVERAKQDPTLARRLSAPPHSAAVLRWLVDGCVAYAREGLATSAVVEAASADYRRESNRLLPFAEDCLELTLEPHHELAGVHLHKFYCDWCKMHGERPASMKIYAHSLEGLGLKRERTRTGAVWRGARIRHEWKDRFGW